MELNVVVGNDYTETEATLAGTGIYIEGTDVPVTKIAVNHTCARFAAKYAAFIGLYANAATNEAAAPLSVQAMETKDGTIMKTTLTYTPENSFLFDTFKLAGLATGCLTLGMNSDGTKLFVTSKMLRDLNKLSEPNKIALTMYMLSICKMCAAFTTNITITKTDALGHQIYKPTWINGLFSFKPNTEIKISEFPMDAITGFTNYKNKRLYKRTPDISILPSIRHSIIVQRGDTPKDTVAYLVIRTESPFGSEICYSCSGTVWSTNVTLNAMNMEWNTFENTLLESVNTTSRITTSASDSTEFVDKALLYFSSIEDYAISEYMQKEFYSFAKTIIDTLNSSEDSAKALQASDTRFEKTKFICTGIVTDPDSIRELYKDDEYAQQLYLQKQPYYDTFELGSIEANVSGFIKGNIYSMLFIGDSGTGKSTCARVLPTRCGFPYVSINFSVNIEESDIFGSMIPNPKKISSDDAEFIWQDGVLTKAIRYGYCAILEEINFARPGVLGKLNSLLDENRQIDLPNGEVLKAHQNFRILATCNIAYEGTNRLNKALINRFENCTVFKDKTRSEIIKIIMERTKYSDKDKIEKVYSIYEAIKKFSKEQNLNVIVSMRQLLNIFKQGRYYTDAKDAVQKIMVNSAFIEDPEYQELFEDTILKVFDLSFKI